MRYKNFGNFIDKKMRDSMRQLKLIEQLLASGGFTVENFMSEGHENDPYIFVRNPNRSTDFDGVRVYKIGESIAFRVQKESETHPFGAAYALNVEDMFNDLMQEDEIDEIQAGHLVVKTVIKELKSFFDQSAEAEMEARAGVFNPEDNTVMKSTGSDYSSKIYSSF